MIPCYCYNRHPVWAGPQSWSCRVVRPSLRDQAMVDQMSRLRRHLVLQRNHLVTPARNRCHQHTGVSQTDMDRFSRYRGRLLQARPRSSRTTQRVRVHVLFMSILVDISSVSITATHAPGLSYPQSSSSSLDGALGTIDPRMLSIQQPIPDVASVPSQSLQHGVVCPPLLKFLFLVNGRSTGYCFHRSPQGCCYRTVSDHDACPTPPSNVYESRSFHKRFRSLTSRSQAYASACPLSACYNSRSFRHYCSRAIQNVPTQYDYSGTFHHHKHTCP
jgi:hypothetical protein